MGATPLITTNNPQNTRSTKPDQATIILRTEMVAGHAGPSGREGRWAARCEEFAFALGQVGVCL